MAKQKAKTATPRLRFPEFLDVGDWNRAPLGRLFSERTESGFIDLPLLSLMDKEGIVPQEESSRKDNSNADKSKYLRVVPGDIAYNTMRMWEGRSAYVGIEGLISPAYTVCAPVGETNGRFFSYYFKTGLLIGQFRKYSQGLVKDTLNLKYENFQRIEIAYPPDRHEQHRIADCLTSLDEVIAAQGRKVEALKAHKRGLMQQLFPREGETRPRLRFPEFRNAPEWITRPLGELMVIGSSRRVHESDWTTAGVPFYRAREIVALGKGESIEPLFIGEDLYSEFAGFTGEIEAGQLLVTGVGSIGVPYLVKPGDRFYFKDGNIIWLKNCQSDISGDFLYRLFESGYVQGQIETMAGIGTVGTYTIENAKRTVAVFPEDKGEQQRIADCLTSLDTQINAQTHQLAALKNQKQGLMQQLFPVPEVTGA